MSSQSSHLEHFLSCLIRCLACCLPVLPNLIGARVFKPAIWLRVHTFPLPCKAWSPLLIFFLWHSPGQLSPHIEQLSSPDGSLTSKTAMFVQCIVLLGVVHLIGHLDAFHQFIGMDRASSIGTSLASWSCPKGESSRHTPLCLPAIRRDFGDPSVQLLLNPLHGQLPSFGLVTTLPYLHHPSLTTPPSLPTPPFSAYTTLPCLHHPALPTPPCPAYTTLPCLHHPALPTPPCPAYTTLPCLHHPALPTPPCPAYTTLP